MDGNEKYQKIKELVDQGGNKNRVAINLNCSIRSINRYINGYKTQGKAFFVHGNTNRCPANKIPSGTKDMIVDLYRTKYYDATYQLFSELLNEFEGICVSEAVVRKTLMASNLLSPQARKQTRKTVRKLLEEKKEVAASVSEKNKLQSLIVDIEDAHARRPRCSHFGEMEQMDACIHPWFGGINTTLHIAVDDAAGTITGAWFDKEETLNGYYNVFRQILMNYGIPYLFYTDKRTIFEYRKNGRGVDEKDTYTQFAYACKQFGVEIKTTSVSQAKGRVERMFWTLQQRLPVLLRLAGVTTIEQANTYLTDYLPKFNKMFALDYNRMKSVFENKPSEERINLTLAIIAKRVVDNGHSIRFNNNYYRTVNQIGTPVYFYKGTEGLVITTFDKKLYFSMEDTIYVLEEIPTHEITSRYFSFQEPSFKQCTRYIPPMSHPWKRSSFEQFKRKQAHRNQLPTGA